jgi:hypothetical protein
MRGATGYVVVDTLIFDDPNLGINFYCNPGEEWILIGADHSRHLSPAPYGTPGGGQSVDSVGTAVYPATVYIVVRGHLPQT